MGSSDTNFIFDDAFDDAFGMPPRAAYIVGNMAAYAIVTSAIYIAITPQTSTGTDYTKSANQKDLVEAAKAAGKDQVGGSSTYHNYDRAVKELSETAKYRFYRQGLTSSDTAFDKTPLLDKAFKALNVRHASFFSPKGGESAAINLFSPLKGNIYTSPWTATSHQALFRGMIQSGMSGTQALGAATSQAGWSFYVTSSIYGVEGHFGAVGIVNAEVNRR